MDFAELHLMAYGALKDLHCRALGPGLCLFTGPNEAGKSTVLSFLRDMLFGFQEARGDKNVYDPAGGDRHGSVTLRVGRELYRVERVSQKGDVRGTAQVVDERGNPLTEEDWRRSFGYPSRELYASVFAFGLSELEDLASLQGNEISDRLYTLGTGLQGTSLPEVRKNLKEETQHLFTRRSRRASLQICRKQLRDLEEEIDSIGDRRAAYADLLAEIEANERETQELEGNRAVLQNRQQNLQALLSVFDACLRLSKMESILQDLTVSTPILDEWRNRLDVLVPEMERFRERCRILDTEQDALRMRLKEIPVDEKLLHVGHRLKASERHWHRIAQDVRQLPSLKEQETTQAKQLLLQLSGIGKEWSEAQLDELSLGMETIQTITGHAKRIQELAAELAFLQRSTQDVRRSAQTVQSKRIALEEEVAALDEGHTDVELEASERAVSRWWSRRRQREESEKILEAAQHHHQRDSAVRSMGILGLGAALLTAFALAAMVFALTQTLLWSLLTACLTGAITLGTCLLLRNRFSREASQELSAGALLDAEKTWEASTEEMKELSHDLLGEIVLDEGLFRQRTEKYLHEQRERRGIYTAKLQQLEEARLTEKTLTEELEKREDEIRNLQQRLEEARGLYSSWLAEIGLPRDLEPEAIEPIQNEIRSARSVKSRLDETRSRIAHLEEEQENAETELKSILKALNRAQGSGSFESKLEDLLAQFEESRRNLDLRKEREAALSAKRREWYKTQEELTHCEEELREILDAANCKTTETFLSRVSEADRRKDMERDAKLLKREITQRAKRLGTIEEILTLVEATDELRARAELKEVDEDLEKTEKMLSNLRSKRGRLQERQSQFASDETLRRLQQERQSLLDQLYSSAEEWSVLTTALYLLDETKQQFEAEHQPSVLARATTLFQTATQSRWVKVQQVLGEERIEVEQDNGQRIEARLLSRGTCELLYLALRFALIQELSSRSEPLPILLDDCLVNMDPQRLRGAVRMIDQAAKNQQVLAFTCHPHIVKALEEEASLSWQHNLGSMGSNP